MASPRHRLTRNISLVGTTLLLGGCALMEIEDAVLTTFRPAGPNAQRLDELFWLVFWIATGVFILVMAGLMVILFAFRDRGKPGSREPKQLHGNAKLEVLWTVIPALILAVIAVPTVRGVFELTGCDDDSMRVEVVGHQWWFEFHYPDFGIDTANVMVIPAGREVCAEMTSEDVLHNFWVPALHGKRYLVPGQTTLLRLEADEPGEFWGHCAEFCGLSHSLMRTRVQAVSQVDFEAWAAAQQEPRGFPEEGTLEFEGYEVFISKACTQCHTVHFDDPDRSLVLPPDAFNGPDLTHFPTRGVFAGAVLPEQGESREDALRRWLADPPNVKPGSFMPNLALTAQEIDRLIAFLEGGR